MQHLRPAHDHVQISQGERAGKFILNLSTYDAIAIHQGEEMISQISAVQFDRPVGNGRTIPARLTCSDDDGQMIEVIAKLSACCDRDVTSLAMEAISAMLAGDLGLPVPQPHIIYLDPEWVSTVEHEVWRSATGVSCALAFGSRAVTPGYTEWFAGYQLTPGMTQEAAGIFAFDALIDNPDRRDGNPNCLVKGESLRIFDHEMAFPATTMIIGYSPPWVQGGLHHLESAGAHIFRNALRSVDVNYENIIINWEAIGNDRIEEYRAALPQEWTADCAAIDHAFGRIMQARNHIAVFCEEMDRVLA